MHTHSGHCRSLGHASEAVPGRGRKVGEAGGAARIPAGAGAKLLQSPAQPPCEFGPYPYCAGARLNSTRVLPLPSYTGVRSGQDRLHESLAPALAMTWAEQVASSTRLPTVTSSAPPTPTPSTVLAPQTPALEAAGGRGGGTPCPRFPYIRSGIYLFFYISVM